MVKRVQEVVRNGVGTDTQMIDGAPGLDPIIKTQHVIPFCNACTMADMTVYRTCRRWNQKIDESTNPQEISFGKKRERNKRQDHRRQGFEPNHQAWKLLTTHAQWHPSKHKHATLLFGVLSFYRRCKKTEEIQVDFEKLQRTNRKDRNDGNNKNDSHTCPDSDHAKRTTPISKA
jgi:hypothetical protein